MSYELAVTNTKIFMETCRLAGFEIALDKSMQPTAASGRVKYLGFLIDSGSMTISLPSDKIEKADNFLIGLKLGCSHTVKYWAQFRGYFISLKPALGNRVFISTRAIANAVARHVVKFGWGGKKKLKLSKLMWSGILYCLLYTSPSPRDRG